MAEVAIIFFDGVCNLCNGFVDYTVRHDKKSYFLFASLQSPKATELLKPFGIEAAARQSVILLENDKVYFKSTAGLRILKKLDGLHGVLYALIIFPVFIRNWVYDFIARNRYRWFGKKETCRVPTVEEKKKFID